MRDICILKPGAICSYWCGVFAARSNKYSRVKGEKKVALPPRSLILNLI